MSEIWFGRVITKEENRQLIRNKTECLQLVGKNDHLVKLYVKS